MAQDLDKIPQQHFGSGFEKVNLAYGIFLSLFIRLFYVVVFM